MRSSSPHTEQSTSLLGQEGKFTHSPRTRDTTRACAVSMSIEANKTAIEDKDDGSSSRDEVVSSYPYQQMLHCLQVKALNNSQKQQPCPSSYSSNSAWDLSDDTMLATIYYMNYQPILLIGPHMQRLKHVIYNN